MSLSPDILIFQLIVFSYFGLVLGSFATAIVHRLPLNQSWVWQKGEGKAARSSCPQCHQVLHVRDLVPVFSWLWQRGRCRYCAASIPVRYLVIEVAAFLSALAIYGLVGFRWDSIFVMAAMPFVISQVALFVLHRLFAVQLWVIIGIICVFYLGTKFLMF